jgi:hypothetical protein
MYRGAGAWIRRCLQLLSAAQTSLPAAGTESVIVKMYWAAGGVGHQVL